MSNNTRLWIDRVKPNSVFHRGISLFKGLPHKSDLLYHNLLDCDPSRELTVCATYGRLPDDYSIARMSSIKMSIRPSNYGSMGIGVYRELIILNPEIRNHADERSPVRPSNLPCESMPLHNRMLERARCEGIADNKARHLVSGATEIVRQPLVPQTHRL